VALLDDLIDDRTIERPVQVFQQQRPCVVFGESVNGQLRESGENVLTCPRASSA
jgi:hypothetical protein